MSDPQWISIGKLAKATGLSVERLRMWELRYGAPESRRLPSGHRRYSVEEVERIHMVREALARGRRPRHIVALKRDALMHLMGDSFKGSDARPVGFKGSKSLVPWTPKTWLAAAGRMDEAYLDRQFYEHWLELGSLRFVTERAQPFVQGLGVAWQRGELCVAEEHFGSEKLGDFMTGIWRRLNQDNTLNPVLLSTLPGDAHRLGLQMAALVSALAGLRVIYLGPSTPLDEIAEAAKRQKVRAVMLSLSQGQDPRVALDALQNLHSSLATDVVLAVGGASAPPSIRDVQRFHDLNDYYHWAREWSAPAALRA